MFFTLMDQAEVIEILDVALVDLSQAEAPFISAEWLKFHPFEYTSFKLIRFLLLFYLSSDYQYVLEERIARKKAVETFLRIKAQLYKVPVIDFLKCMLHEPEHYLIDAVVRCLG